MYRIVLLLLLICSSSFAAHNVFVTKDGTKMRKSNSESSGIKNIIKKGVQVEMVEELGDWYKISYKGSTGYISKKNGLKIKVADKTTKPKTAAKPAKKKVDKKTKKENAEWSKFKIDDLGDVEKAYRKAQAGNDGAIVALVNGLENKDKKVRMKCENSLISIGQRSLKPLYKKTRSKIYLIKSNAVSIMGKIKSPKAVPYLERSIRDKSIEKEVIDALNMIGGADAKKALERYNKSLLMSAKMDSIKAYEEKKRKVSLKKLGLTYGDTKNNILDVAMKLVQYEKTNTPKTDKVYLEYKEAFSYLVKKYDNALGSNATSQLLKDNGYSKDILK